MVADKAQIARTSFLQTLNFIDQENAPEKYHLYCGLIALSEAMIDMGTEMERLKREVRIAKKR
jgi:hypothetical protein